MKNKAIILILFIIVVLTSLVVYAQKVEKMDMYGEIIELVFDEQGKLREIFVENTNEDNEPYDKVVAIITENTILNKDFEISELEEGQGIGIVFKEGPITMIYPARVEAELIKIENDLIKPQIEVPANLEIEEEFNVLLENDIEISGILDFIDNSISTLSRENASIMINEFEVIQKKNLSKIEEKYYDSEIQIKIYEVYEPEFDLNKINDRNTINMINDQELRELLLETRSSGYKVETAEGMFFPIINYEYYQRYSAYVSSDMREYIEIMAAESHKVPAKDAALVITWDEVLKRALSQEKFIIQYPESLKINDVKDLYKKYLTFTLFGLNNTPLFNYDSYEISTEAKNIYMNAVDSNENSIFIKTLQEFLDILKVNNFRLTEEVDKYRKGIVENILSDYSPNESTGKDIIAAMQSDIDILKVESNVQQIEESNYGDCTQITRVLKVTDNELQFDAVTVVFSVGYKGHYTRGESYPYYTDAAMGGQRGIIVKDNFGVWHSFGYRVNLDQ